MAKSKRGYLEPKVADPSIIRKHKNGQAINPPSFMEMGGFTGPSKLNRDDSNMGIERGGPQAKKGKPF
jgi:hypothetical protein